MSSIFRNSYSLRSRPEPHELALARVWLCQWRGHPRTPARSRTWHEFGVVTEVTTCAARVGFGTSMASSVQGHAPWHEFGVVTEVTTCADRVGFGTSMASSVQGHAPWHEFGVVTEVTTCAARVARKVTPSPHELARHEHGFVSGGGHPRTPSRPRILARVWLRRQGHAPWHEVGVVTEVTTCAARVGATRTWLRQWRGTPPRGHAPWHECGFVGAEQGRGRDLNAIWHQ